MKKILIGAILCLVLITVIVTISAAVGAYNYEMDPANGVDILEGFAAGILLVLGGFAVFCEFDLFFTVYYFFMKQKTLAKSLFMALSQLMLFLVLFSESLAKFLSRNVSDFFREEGIVVAGIAFLYIILRITCITICFSEKKQGIYR